MVLGWFQGGPGVLHGWSWIGYGLVLGDYSVILAWFLGGSSMVQWGAPGMVLRWFYGDPEWIRGGFRMVRGCPRVILGWFWSSPRVT